MLCEEWRKSRAEYFLCVSNSNIATVFFSACFIFVGGKLSLGGHTSWRCVLCGALTHTIPIRPDCGQRGSNLNLCFFLPFTTLMVECLCVCVIKVVVRGVLWINLFQNSGRYKAKVGTKHKHLRTASKLYWLALLFSLMLPVRITSLEIKTNKTNLSHSTCPQSSASICKLMQDDILVAVFGGTIGNDMPAFALREMNMLFAERSSLQAWGQVV